MRVLRGMARTAVVAGTATAVSNRVSRRQARRWGTDQPQEVYYQESQPAPAAPDPDAQMAQLERLGQLKTKGLITDQEFEAKKQEILGLY